METLSIYLLPFELVNHSKLAFDVTGHETTEKAEERFVYHEPVTNHDAPPVQTYTQPQHTSNPTEERFSEAKHKPVEINSHALKAVSIDAEYEMIVQALKKANYNKSKAAKLLNVDRKTLYNKMKQYNEFNEQ
jgi:two-component system response regulator HydG